MILKLRGLLGNFTGEFTYSFKYALKMAISRTVQFLSLAVRGEDPHFSLLSDYPFRN
jgi:hypothetical protein